MAVAPKAAFGTLLKKGADTILGVRNLGGPEYSLETIDVTHHSSASSYRETVASFLSAGTVNFDLLYDSNDSIHQALFTQFEARTALEYSVTFTDTGAEVHTFDAYVTQMSLSAPIDDAITMSCVLTITGAVVRT